MFSILRVIQHVLILLALALCFNCTLEDIADCILGRRPELTEKVFPVGRFAHYYLVEISAEIKNEPNDNDYDYFFQIDESSLPSGIEFNVEHRVVRFSGIPLERCTFEITVYLDVEGYDEPYYDEDGEIYYSDGLCSSSTFETYTLVIE